MNFSYLLVVLAVVVHTTAALKTWNQQAVLERDSAMEKERVGPLCADVDANGHVTIPDSVTSIGDSAFEWCTSLESVTIPNSVTSINYRAFLGCSALTSVTIPNSVTSIGDGAFRKCTSLTSVTIPDSVTIIEQAAFKKCTSLTSVTIPDSVTSLGPKVFRDCTALTSVTLGSGFNTIEILTFDGCTSLHTVDFGSNSHVTHILSNAFRDTAITEIDFGDMVMHIGDHAFHGTGLTNVEIPAGCYLGHNAFPTDVAITYGYNAMLGTVPTPAPTPATGLIQMETANSLRTAENSGIVGGSSDLGRFKEMSGIGGGTVTLEDSFLRDCRALAEIAEKSGSLWDCMKQVGNKWTDNDCRTTIELEITNRINAGDMDADDEYAIETREHCFECFAKGTGRTDCPSEMQGCKSTRKFTDVENDKLTYDGPDGSYNGAIEEFDLGSYESDRLYGCFGLTGHGLDPCMHPSPPASCGQALLEQRAGEGGRSNASSFMRTTGGKA